MADMGVIVTIADPNDGGLKSEGWKHQGGQDANPDFEDDARRGEGAIIDPANDVATGQRIAIGGQMWNGMAQTNRYEAFLMFTPARGFALPTGVDVVSASIRVGRDGMTYDAGASDATFGAKDSLQFWTRDWNPPLSGSAWMNTIPLQGSGSSGNFQPEAEINEWVTDRTTFGNLYEAGGELFLDNLLAKLAANDTVSYTVTNWTSIQKYPKDASWLSWIVATSAADVFERRHPTIILRTQRKHALNYVGGASIQMTDGTAVFLRYDTTSHRVNLYYQKVNQSTPTLIDYVSTSEPGFDNKHGETQYMVPEPAFQAFGLTRDDANNLYVTGPRGNPQVGVYGQKIANACGFRYNGSYSWTRFTNTGFGESTIDDFSAPRGLINNTVPVWVPKGVSPAGQLVAVHARRDGQWGRFQLGVYTNDAGWMFGTASVKGNSVNYAGDDGAIASYWRPWNSSGSNLDAFRDGNVVRMASSIQPLATEDQERSAGLTCSIGTDNKVGKPTIVTPTVRALPQDPDGKVRALWLGDSSPYWAIIRAGHIQIIKKSDGSILRELDIPSTNIPVFPSTLVLQKSQAWDAVWDSGDPNFLWIYYRSATNPRHVQKARYNITNGVMDAGFTWTTDPLGPSGAEIVAIRAPRQQVDARCVLIDVALQDGTGAPIALVTMRDTTMNRAPGKPVPDAVSSFNASGSKAVTWTFNDANLSDFATAQDIEIKNVATGAIAHDVDHTAVSVVSAGARKYQYTIPASALANDTSYQIRFRAYDSVDFPSDWSDWLQFSTTTTGGYVEITDPPTDSAPLNASGLTVKWRYSNTTPSKVQTGYQVKVFNNSTGAQVYDSNVVSSTATSHAISGLVSDIEYRVEVSVRDSSSTMSGAGVRIIFPDYNNPSLPQIISEAHPGYIEIRVTNPAPTGENPVTAKNQIARKEAQQPESEYKVIGECGPNGVYQDWTVASGVSYTYKARGSSN